MARKSRFSELCKDTSLIFLLVGINGLQRDILYQGFRSRWSRVRLLMEVSRVEGTMSRVDFLLVVFYVFFLRFLSEWGSADTEMHCWGPPRGCMFPCSLEKFRAVPLFLMNRLSCSRNSLLPSSPVPRNSASCSVDPQKYFYIFPQFLSYFILSWLVIFIGFTSLVIVQILLGKTPPSPPWWPWRVVVFARIHHLRLMLLQYKWVRYSYLEFLPEKGWCLPT